MQNSNPKEALSEGHSARKSNIAFPDLKASLRNSVIPSNSNKMLISDQFLQNSSPVLNKLQSKLSGQWDSMPALQNFS